MKLEILRRESAASEPRWESFSYEPADGSETVATALTKLNETMDDPIRWERNCLQKSAAPAPWSSTERQSLPATLF